MTDMLREQTEVEETQTEQHEHHQHHQTGLKRWLFTTNHKDIGSLYLMFSFAMFLIGGAMAMVIRTYCMEAVIESPRSG